MQCTEGLSWVNIRIIIIIIIIIIINRCFTSVFDLTTNLMALSLGRYQGVINNNDIDNNNGNDSGTNNTSQRMRRPQILAVEPFKTNQQVKISISVGCKLHELFFLPETARELGCLPQQAFM